MELPEHSGVSPTLGFPWGGNPKWCAPWERTLGFTQPGSCQVSLFTASCFLVLSILHLGEGGVKPSLRIFQALRVYFAVWKTMAWTVLYTKLLPIPQEQFLAYWCPQSPPPPPHPPPSSENKKTVGKKSSPSPTAVVGLLGKIAVWQLLQVLRPH